MTRVLIVDDSDILAMTLHDLLEHYGFDVVDASRDPGRLLDPSDEIWDGADVLITDLRMPEVPGLELLAHARIYHPSVRRIVLTGWDPDSEPVALAREVADLVLRKPDDVLSIPRLLADSP